MVRGSSSLPRSSRACHRHMADEHLPNPSYFARCKSPYFCEKLENIKLNGSWMNNESHGDRSVGSVEPRLTRPPLCPSLPHQQPCLSSSPPDTGRSPCPQSAQPVPLRSSHKEGHRHGLHFATPSQYGFSRENKVQAPYHLIVQTLYGRSGLT